MNFGESTAAVVFYAGSVALGAGAVLAARHAVERRRGSARLGIVLVAGGLSAVVIAVIVFASGPRSVLPF